MTDTMIRMETDPADDIHRRASATVFNDDSDLSMEVRRLIPKYLYAREAYEETFYPHGDAAYEYAVARDALVEVFVGLGAYADAATAASAIESFAYWTIPCMLVERWVHLEGLSTRLGSGEIAGIAESVRSWVADGTRLADLDMWKLADPYLTGGDL